MRRKMFHTKSTDYSEKQSNLSCQGHSLSLSLFTPARAFPIQGEGQTTKDLMGCSSL
jgi:hypothetical protein